MLSHQQNYKDARSLKLGLESRKPGFNPGLFHLNQVTSNKSCSLSENYLSYLKKIIKVLSLYYTQSN